MSLRLRIRRLVGPAPRGTRWLVIGAALSRADARRVVAAARVVRPDEVVVEDAVVEGGPPALARLIGRLAAIAPVRRRRGRRGGLRLLVFE